MPCGAPYREAGAYRIRAKRRMGRKGQSAHGGEEYVSGAFAFCASSRADCGYN